MLLERVRMLLDRYRWVVLGVYVVALAAVTHWPRLDVTGGHNEIGTPVVQFDKTVHVVAFGLLQWLILRAAARTPRRLGMTLVSLGLGIGYALADEYTQRWFQREVLWSDLTASLIGVVGVTVLWLAPARAAHDAARGWRVWVTRALWVGLAPTLVALVTMPRLSGGWLSRIVDWATQPGTYNDKRAHFALSVVLTWLLAAAAPAGRSRPRLSAAVAMLVMGVSAPVIELVQKQTGRGFEVADVFAHEAGLLVGVMVWALGVLAFRWTRPARDMEAPLPMTRAAASPVTAGAGGAARAAASGREKGFVGHAALVSGLTFVSRLTGLVRDSILAAVFGLGPVSDAFWMGFLVPNLFRRLFGEGALSASFIPHYTDLLKKNPQAARGFATLCLTLLTALLCAITVVGELGLWWALQRPGWDPQTQLALRLTMVMLPYMPLICVAALIGGVLQVHERFGSSSATPIILNLGMIAGAAWGTWGIAAGAANDTALSYTAVIVGISVVLAGFAQVIWQGLELGRVAPLRFDFAGTRESLRGMLVMLLPMLVGLAVFQINTFMDSGIAFALSQRPGGNPTGEVLGLTFDYPMDAGAVAALTYAQRLYQFPLGVFGIAIATAIFPALAGASTQALSGAKGEASEFSKILRQGLRLTVFIGLPASVGLIVLRLPLSRVVYERGAFTFEDAERVAVILAAYSLSIWAYSATHVLTRGFYALKDSRTPLKVSLGMVGVNLVLNLTLIWPLGAAGLALSTATTAVGQVVLLIVAIGKRVPQPVDAYVLKGWARTAALSAVMGAALWPFAMMLGDRGMSNWATAGAVAALVSGGAAIFFGGAWVTGAEELGWLRRRGR